MLLYRGSRQAPRKYPVPETAQEQTHRSSLCVRCRAQLWCPTLYFNLRGVAATSAKRFVTTYQVSATELRQSVITGCKWCQTLADGIHGRIFLDNIYEQWNRTDSDVSSTNNEDEHEEGNDASEINDGVEPDPTGGFDLDEDFDTLAVECTFSVELSFEKDEYNLFSSVIAHVESALSLSDDHDNPATRLRGEESVDLCYHVNFDTSSLPSDPSSAANTQIYVQRRSGIASLFRPDEGATTLGSEAGLERLSSWTQSIRSDSSPPTGESLHVPSRLIDIGTSELRVVSTSDLQPAEDHVQGYVALSYVWGVKQTFVLLRRTLPSLMLSFTIDKLPRTIQDAVIVARRIGFRYLWVDALCIIQDADEDKRRELPKMGKIYQCAALTLVAAVAKSALGGFLHIQEQRLYHIDPIEIPYFPDINTSDGQTIKLSYAADYKRWKDPINDRGWTFQEYMLSPLIASFSYRGIETMERRTRPVADGAVLRRNPPLQDLAWKQPGFTLSPEMENIRYTWLAVRGEYSQRRLGEEKDKLVAISAVAQELGRSYNTRYLAGLWERDLADELKWCHGDVVHYEEPSEDHRPRRTVRPESYIAPSWSWASINGPVDDYTYEGGVPVKDWLGFEVTHCETTPAIADFEYGAVTAGKLVVLGRMHSFFWRPEDEPTVECDGSLMVKTNEEPYSDWIVGEVIVDCIDPALIDGCIVECLAMSLVERIPGRDEIECLVLLPADDETFRRVGFGKVFVTALYDDAEPVEIEII